MHLRASFPVALIITAQLLSAPVAQAQFSSIANQAAEPVTIAISDMDWERYFKEKVPSDYKSNVVDKKLEYNYRLLKRYLEKKTSLLDQLRRTLRSYSRFDAEDTLAARKLQRDLEDMLRNKNTAVWPELERRFTSLAAYQNSSAVYDLADEGAPAEKGAPMIIGLFPEILQEYRKELVEKDFLRQNIAVILDDIDFAQQQIDLALDPEHRAQSYRQQISTYYVMLIGGFLFLFLLAVYFGASRGLHSRLLSDSGLQFVTIFSILIAVILFGILDILKGSELAAILSGMSGYILGKNRGSGAEPSPLRQNAAAPGAAPPPASAGSSHPLV